MLVDKRVLADAGYGNTSPEDYHQKNIVLRDGRDAILWLHKQTGHGILDPEFWEGRDYYVDKYRKEFSATLGKQVEQSEHLRVYKNLNAKQFNTFSRYLTKDNRYLEIGCSFGGVFNLVSGYGVEVCHGVEPNQNDAAFVSHNNPDARVFNATLEDAELSEDYYDLIVSNEVLEHTVNPRAFLRKCYSLLRKGGVIHLEVPNHNDVLLSAYQNTSYDRFFYHKAHIHYFSVSSFQELCQQCGFKGKVSSFLMYPLFNQVWWYQNHGPQPSASLALSTPVPTAGKSDAEKAINVFYERVEREYEELVNSYMLGDCLIFQGTKNE